MFPFHSLVLIQQKLKLFTKKKKEIFFPTLTFLSLKFFLKNKNHSIEIVNKRTKKNVKITGVRWMMVLFVAVMGLDVQEGVQGITKKFTIYGSSSTSLEFLKFLLHCVILSVECFSSRNGHHDRQRMYALKLVQLQQLCVIKDKIKITGKKAL